MTTMLERAARAAYHEYGFTSAWDADPEHPFASAQHDTKEKFRSVVRAVLMAVRVPCSEVVESGMIAGEFSGMADTAFTAIIDAILEGK